MTKTGWVFVVLNLLLAVFFWSATTPVLEKRSKLRKDLKTERDKITGYFDANDKRIPSLAEQIAEADRKRAFLKGQAVSLQNHHVEMDEAGRGQRIKLQTDLSLLRDELNSAQSRSANWKGSLAKVQNEINARDTELKSLDGEVQQYAAFGSQLKQDISTLRSRLESAKAEFQRTMEQIGKVHDQIVATTKQFPETPASTDNIATRQ